MTLNACPQSDICDGGVLGFSKFGAKDFPFDGPSGTSWFHEIFNAVEQLY